MLKSLPILLVASSVATLTSNTAQAQDFRIYTRVFDDSPATLAQQKNDPQAGPKVIARSLSLFHAGKIYDYMDSVQELVVFEPGHERFTVIHGTRLKATTVEFAQLRQFLRVAETEADKYLEELKQTQSPTSKTEASALAFQLDPNFEQSFDRSKKLLQLSSPQFNYKVRCETPKIPEVVETYLQYADWTSRLNYVLHPKTLLPGPRLAVNKALKKHQQIPTRVELTMNVNGTETKLRAEHSIRWELDATDRGRIHEWEQLLTSPRVTYVSIHDYQRAFLTAQSERR